MSEFREKIGKFYNNHERGLIICHNIAGWICGTLTILLLGFVILGIAGSGVI